MFAWIPQPGRQQDDQLRLGARRLLDIATDHTGIAGQEYTRGRLLLETSLTAVVSQADRQPYSKAQLLDDFIVAASSEQSIAMDQVRGRQATVDSMRSERAQPIRPTPKALAC
jgi:hypothetical protein